MAVVSIPRRALVEVRQPEYQAGHQYQREAARAVGDPAKEREQEPAERKLLGDAGGERHEQEVAALGEVVGSTRRQVPSPCAACLGRWVCARRAKPESPRARGPQWRRSRWGRQTSVRGSVRAARCWPVFAR